MTHTTEADLLPWNDPDDLLQALYGVENKPRPELREAIARLLEHEDSDIRSEALRILVTRWKDRAFRPHAVKALRFDPQLEVRTAAAFALASTSAEVDRADDTRLLLDVLIDDEEATDVRGAAYDALLIVHRRPQFPTKKRDFNPAQDVDWPWIETLRPGG
jgi:HEAT repeat protein